MRKKIIFTSLYALTIIGVANATTFPDDGYMQTNQTYDDAATYENTGVYDGTATATAEYNDCPANSYCDGNSEMPTACPSGYSQSDAGSDSASDCYRDCTANDVLNSTSATGRVYSDGRSVCNATGCLKGYQVKPGLDLNAIIGTVAGDDFTEDASTMTFSVDYGSAGVITGHAQCSSQSGIGVWNGASTSDEITTRASLPDSSGQYCYCTLDGYTPDGGTIQSLSAPWVFDYGIGDAGSCAVYCAHFCADRLWDADANRLVFRSAVFGSLGALATCSANTISINWTGATPEAVSANNAGTCTYGGDIRTPQSVTPVPGKTFKGWTFKK